MSLTSCQAKLSMPNREKLLISGDFHVPQASLRSTIYRKNSYCSQVSHDTHQSLCGSALRLRIAAPPCLSCNSSKSASHGQNDNVYLQQPTFCCRSPHLWATQLHNKDTVSCNTLMPSSHISFTRQASAGHAYSVTWSRSCRKLHSITLGRMTCFADSRKDDLQKRL